VSQVTKIELDKEAREDALRGLKEFFQAERDETLSDFQATFILDFVLTGIGPYIYNQALMDAHALMSDRIEDLYGLEKYPAPTKPSQE
jgi:uncharacterized protein (DUF2164 family)